MLPRAQDSYDTVWLIEVLTQLGAFYAGQQVVLLWDGLSAHWSHDMRAWLDTQRDWLQVERLPAYAPELNPVEYLWANLKGVELANFAGDTVVQVATPPSRASTEPATTSNWSGHSWPTPALPSTTSTYPTYEKLNIGWFVDYGDPQARLRHGLGELYAYWAQNTAAVANILLDAQVLGHLGVGRRLLALQRDAPRCSPGAGRPQTSTSQRWRPRSGSRWTSTPGSAWSVSGACPSRQRSSLP